LLGVRPSWLDHGLRTMSHRPALHAQRGRHRGLSIVELMIGIAIGLFIVAGATLMLTTQLGDNRRLLLEAQIQQDMRAAADMISRDIRRAGYWAHSYRQVWPGPGALTNPYTRFEPDTASGGPSSVEFDRSTDEEGGRQIGTDDNGVDAESGRPRERVGFRLNTTNQTIDYLLGGSSPWQALTDKEVLEITLFRLDVATRNLPVPCGAGPQCPVLGPGGCPLVLTYRDVTINITARARHDDAVQRALRDNVRLRNGEQREVCP
jgi:prepilin peptidase dependent protein B